MNMEYIGYAVGAGILAYLLFGRKKGAKPSPTQGGKGWSKSVVRTLKNPHTRFMTVLGDGTAATYNREKPPVVAHPDGSFTSINAHESGYDLFEDDVTGITYLSAEESGGEVYNADTGAVVFRGGANSTICTRRILGELVTISSNWNGKSNDCRIQVNGGQAMFVNYGGHKMFFRYIIESASGTKALAFAYDYDGNVGGFFRSSDLRNWEFHALWKNKRPMKAIHYQGGVAFTFSTYKNGQRTYPGGVALWKQGSTTILDETQLGRIGMGIAVIDDLLYYTTMDNWKGDGESHVIEYDPTTNKSTTIATFPEAEAWGLVKTKKNNLYVGTGQEGGNAVLYKLTRGKPAIKPDIPSIDSSRTVMPAAIRYKVRSGHTKETRTGNLVILLPSSMGNVDVIMGAGTDKAEKGRFAGRTNGDRPTYYFSHPGFWWDSPCPIDVGDNKWIIKDTSWDNRYGHSYSR